MKTLIKTTIVAVALTCGTLYAGGSHSHDGEHGHSHTQVEVSKSYVEKVAIQDRMKLIKKKQIDASWSNIPTLNIEKKQFHHNTEWVVSFKNEKIKDKSKQVLYIFVSLYGQVTGANYTGQ